MPVEEGEFSTILREAILDTMNSVLGASSLKAILFHLAPVQFENPRKFHMKLSSIFKEGALVLEKIIVKELFRRLSLPYEEKGALAFKRYVDHAKEVYTARMKEAT